MVEQILQNCTVDGTVVRLPEGQLERDVYLEIKKRLEKIGGKWKGNKIQGFVFPHDPTDLLADIANGKVRNIKKEFQFFETPPTVADRLIELAEIQRGNRVLEPSAGRGAIVRRLPYFQLNPVYCYELNKALHPELEQLEATVIGDDFLNCTFLDQFDRIVANPPFSKNQDIDHIRKMYDVLAPNGVLVSVASTHWQISNNRKGRVLI